MKPNEMNQIIEEVLKHQDAEFYRPVQFEIYKNEQFIYSWNGKNKSVIEFEFSLKDGYELRSAMDVMELLNLRFSALEIIHYDRDDKRTQLFVKMDF
jgi:hypothetical protein